MARQKELKQVQEPPRTDPLVSDANRGSTISAISDTLSDAELALAVKEGHTDALRVLVDRHSKKAYWTAFN